MSCVHAGHVVFNKKRSLSEIIIASFARESRLVATGVYDWQCASEKLVGLLEDLVSPELELARSCIIVWRRFGDKVKAKIASSQALHETHQALDLLAQSYDLPPLPVIESGEH